LEGPPRQPVVRLRVSLPNGALLVRLFGVSVHTPSWRQIPRREKVLDAPSPRSRYPLLRPGNDQAEVVSIAVTASFLNPIKRNYRLSRGSPIWANIAIYSGTRFLLPGRFPTVAAVFRPLSAASRRATIWEYTADTKAKTEIPVQDELTTAAKESHLI
jgi:hypothetical protein